MRPVIEDLVIDGFSLRNVYLGLRRTADIKDSWFADFYKRRGGNSFDWSRVKTIVEKERDHLFGIPLLEWIDYGLKGYSHSQIESMTHLTRGLVTRAMREICGLDVYTKVPKGFEYIAKDIVEYFSYMCRRAYTIYHLYRGAPLDVIYYLHFSQSGSTNEMIEFFVSLFPDMSPDSLLKCYRYPIIADWDNYAMRLFQEIPFPIRNPIFKDLTFWSYVLSSLYL